MMLVGRAVGGLRADLKRNSQDSRLARLRDLDALRRDAADARFHYQSPVQMLARDSIGSERRSRLMQQLEHSGDAELASLAALAVSAKDRELAAVLVSRVQRVPHAERPFSPHELADLLVGEEHRAVTAAIMEVEEIADRAMAEDRAFETGRASPERAVGLALKARDRAALEAADLIDITEPAEENRAMAAYAFFPVREDLRRSDGLNFAVATAATALAARAAAETLLGEPNALAGWTPVDLASAPAAFVHGLPVGARAQSVWPNLDRGGSYLKGA